MPAKTVQVSSGGQLRRIVGEYFLVYSLKGAYLRIANSAKLLKKYMEKIVQTIFQSFFQTKRRVTIFEQYAVVISIVCLATAYAFILMEYGA